MAKSQAKTPRYENKGFSLNSQLKSLKEIMRNPSQLKLKKLQNRAPVAFTPRYGGLSTDTNARRKNHGQQIFEQSLNIKHDSHLKLPMLSSPKNNNDISTLKFSQMR